MNLSVAQGDPGPLVYAVVKPQVRQGFHARCAMVRVDNTSNDRLLHTGVRLRKTNLFPIDSTAFRKYRAAVKDQFGVWSEWSNTLTYEMEVFEPGYDECSIGSASDSDVEIEEPQAHLIQAQLGSSQSKQFKTDMFGGWPNEVRGSLRNTFLRAFALAWQDLKANEKRLQTRWIEAMTGALKLFWFEWLDPYTRRRERMILRPAGTETADSTFSYDHSEASINMLEQLEAADGGER